MATFVLVAGAWHGGWCWERIVPLLEKGGHRVTAPDLLAMGDDKTPVETVTLAMWADQIAALIKKQSEPVVLVGHSRGGIVISEVAERVPERIKTLVYLAAFLVKNGNTLIQTSGAPPEVLQHFLQMGHNNSSTVRDEDVKPRFYNTTPEEWVERAKAKLKPEPSMSFITPLSVSPARFGAVPRAYIECVHDNAVTLPLQRAMQAELPCKPVITMDTDHSPFFSAPQDLADNLMTIAKS